MNSAMQIDEEKKEVAFEPVNGSINDSIDDTYRAKYASSLYL
jgi:hypothetical protein